MKIKGINHVTLLVKDKKATETFFTEVLGLEKYDAGGHLWIKVGEQFIHITDNSGEPRGNNFYHFAIEIEDVVKYAKEIANRGVKVFDFDDNQNEISVNLEFDKPDRHFFFRDLDGNLIELVDANNQIFNPRHGV